MHQTYVSKDLPQELKQNVEYLKKTNPGWTHRLFDDQDIIKFIHENYGTILLDYYRRINPKYGAARADLFRYLLVYKYGGVYIDIKSSCNSPLNNVLLPDDRYILTHWRNSDGEVHAQIGKFKELEHIEQGEYQQWYIISVAGHPFLRSVIKNVLTNIDKYRPWTFGTGGIGVLRLSGPIAYTLAIHPILHNAPHRLLKNESLIDFQYSIYNTAKHHRSVYKVHYFFLTESIVRMSFVYNILGNIYSFLKKNKNIIKKQINI
ncbi:MAG: glycosyltransferase [Rickettsiales bacterium]|nr:MAG: glycosyltransferase [Rickettsiales bacterium]